MIFSIFIAHAKHNKFGFSFLKKTGNNLFE